VTATHEPAALDDGLRTGVRLRRNQRRRERKALSTDEVMATLRRVRASKVAPVSRAANR
jgi:hypothetical protein